MRNSTRCFLLLWAAIGCVDDGSKLPETMVFPGTFLRTTIGCQRERDEVISAAQSFLGCSADTTPIDVGDGAASGDPTQAPTLSGPAEFAGAGAGVAGNAGPGVPSAQAGGAGGSGAPPASGMMSNAGAGGVASAAIMCGGAMCSALPAGQSCCLDAAAGICGMQSGALCVALPDPNAPCPNIDLTRQGYGILAPCCTTDRQCGVNTQRIPGGMPCTPLMEAKRQAESMGYRDIVPAPRACPMP